MNMREWGYLVLGSGILYLIIAFNLDVTVSTSPTYVPGLGSVGEYGEVVNFDLIERRRNHLIVAGLLTLIGAMMAIFGGAQQSATQKESAVAKPRRPSNFDGERDLSSDAYRLWLAEHYGIERNSVFDRFVMVDQTFDSLDAALAEAHDRELAIILAAQEAQAQREADRQAQLDLQAEAKERADAQWEEDKPKFIVGSILILALAIGAFWLFAETPEEREARLAVEEAERASERQALISKFPFTLPEDADSIAAREVTDHGFMCDDESYETILLEYNTDESEEETIDRISDKLGEIVTRSSYLDDPYWEHDGKKYVLTVFNGVSANFESQVNLCEVTN